MLKDFFKKRDVALIVIAAVCAVLGIVVVHGYIDRVTGEYRSQLDNLVQVVVLTKPLRKGEMITRDIISSKEVPLLFLPPKVVRHNEESIVNIVERPVNSIVEAGDILLWYNLDTELYSSISDVLERGQKAVTLPVDSITGMSGLLKPKIRIDLYATYNENALVLDQAEAGARANDLVAVRLFENVLLVAVGQRWTESARTASDDDAYDAYSTVTIMVEEKDVERTILAQELARRQGTRIFCVLRSEMDAGTEKKDLPPVSQKDFFAKYNAQQEATDGRRARR